MEKERLQKAGDYILDGVLIVGSSGARINVIEQVQELNIYESIETPYISANLLGWFATVHQKTQLLSWAMFLSFSAVAKLFDWQGQKSIHIFL